MGMETTSIVSEAVSNDLVISCLMTCSLKIIFEYVKPKDPI